MIQPIDISAGLIGTLAGAAPGPPSSLPPSAGPGPAGLLQLASSATGPPGSVPAASADLLAGLMQQLAPNDAALAAVADKQAEILGARVQAAAEALNGGRLQEARTGARDLLRQDHDNPIAYHLLGRVASEAGDLQEAAAYFDQASRLAPESERFADDAFVARALQRAADDILETAAELVRRPDSAVRGLRLLFEMGRRSERPGAVALGIARGFETLDLPLQQLEAYESVVETGTFEDLRRLEGELRRFIERHEPVGLAHALLGRTQQRLGRFDDAVQSLERAREIAPETSRYTSELANAHASAGNDALGRGDLAGARHRFTIAHELDLADRDIALGLAAVHVSIARRHLDAGLDNDARNQLRRARTLLGDDPALDLEIARAHLRLAERARARQQTSLALADLQDAHARQPDLPGLDRQLADAHRAAAQSILDANPAGDLSTIEHDSVVAHYRAAFELFPERASFRGDFAEALNDFGVKLMNENMDYQRAVETFKQARDLDPANPTYLANWQQAWTLDNP